MRAVIAAGIIIAGWLFSMTGSMADDNSVALEILWSTPVTAPDRSPGMREPDIVFTAQAMKPDGRIIFLGRRIAAGKRVRTLFTGPEHNPSENAIDLALKDPHPGDSLSASYPVALAVGGSGEVWVAGS